MKAVVYEKFGPPEVLQLTEIKKPSPKENEVRIRVRATAVTTGDVNARGLVFVPPGLGPLARLALGLTRPRKPILGSEVAGEIDAVGRDVRSFRVGDRVFGINSADLGTYAEYVCWPEESALVEKPGNLNFEEAAAIPFGATTALYFLRNLGELQSGQKVLINGASGGVGTAAVQIAKHFGANVTGVCSTANLELVTSLGADQVIDYTQEDFSQRGETYDIIADTVVGKTSFSRCKGALREHGRYLAIAGGLKELAQKLWTSMVGGKQVIFGGGEGSERREIMLLIKELIESGKLSAVIDRRYTLEQIVEAHRYVDAGHKRGNVVITVTGDAQQ